MPMDHAPSIPRTLVVTADFPPTVGGVQQYVHSLVHHLPAEQLTVLTGTHEGWQKSDAGQPFEVRRVPSTWLWPGPRLTEHVRRAARAVDARVILFASGYPAASSGPALAREGIPFIVTTHGIEHWVGLVPGGPSLMGSAFKHANRVTAISRFTARSVRRAVPADVPLSICHPGVDTTRFSPEIDGSHIRERHGIGDRPLVVCISRFVKRKGQDVLVQGMAHLRRRVPDAVLLLAGTGPDHDRVVGLARQAPVGSVVFAGVIPEVELPSYHAAADVFAMPCRERNLGMDIEGFGMVFTEAAACGKPVVAGRSGGAAEAVVDGETGLVVDPRQPEAVAEAIAGLLVDPFRSSMLGKAGRTRAERELSWPAAAARYATWLSLAAKEGQ